MTPSLPRSHFSSPDFGVRCSPPKGFFGLLCRRAWREDRGSPPRRFPLEKAALRVPVRGETVIIITAATPSRFRRHSGTLVNRWKRGTQRYVGVCMFTFVLLVVVVAVAVVFCRLVVFLVALKGFPMPLVTATGALEQVSAWALPQVCRCDEQAFVRAWCATTAVDVSTE